MEQLQWSPIQVVMLSALKKRGGGGGGGGGITEHFI